MRQFVAILPVLALAAATAAADTVKLVGRPAFRRVEVRDFRGGRLVFRGLSGQLLNKPLPEVEWIELDELPDFGRGEHAAAAQDWAGALSAYQDAASAAVRPWHRRLVRVRLAAVADHAGRFDLAVALFAELVRSDPEGRLSSAPRRPAPPGSETNTRALTSLEASLSAGLLPDAEAALRTLLLELALYEDLDPLPSGLEPPNPGGTGLRHRLPSTAPASRPAGILPPESPPPAEPEPASRPAAVGLPRDTFLLRVVEAAVEAEDYRRAGRLVERSLPFVAAGDRGRWLVLGGRVRIGRSEHAAAAADLLGLASQEKDPEVRGLALYYVGVAHEKMGRADVAAGLYRELLERPDTPDSVRTLARGGQRRLGG